LKKINLINSYPSLIREYSPYIESNVYTYLDAFILDFGIIGAIIGSALLGLLGRIIYFKMNTGKTLFTIIVYSMFSFYSAFIFMNNEFIRFSFILLIVKALIIEILIHKKSINESN